MSRTGITVGSVLVGIIAARADPFAEVDAPSWHVRGESGLEDWITLDEVFTLIRRWLDEGKLSAIRDLTELKLWT